MWRLNLCGPRDRQHEKKENQWLQSPCPLLSAKRADNIKVATCLVPEGHVWAKWQSGKAPAMSFSDPNAGTKFLHATMLGDQMGAEWQNG